MANQDETDPPRQPVLAIRLLWLVGLRVAFLTLAVGLTGLFYLHSGFRLGSYSNRVLLGVFLVGIGGAVAVGVTQQHRGLVPAAYLELLIEQVCWTGIVYVTGGAASGATAFFGLTCVAGAVLLGQRGVLTATIAGGALYILLCAGFVSHALDAPPDQIQTSYVTGFSEIIYPCLLNLLVFMVVALLAENLSARLRLTGGRLAEATARAEQAERLAALGRVSAGLAHEIRNPLSSITGSIQLLSSAPGLGPDGRQLCAIIERETARLNDLVDDMLQLARPKAPVLTCVDVTRTVREVVALASQSGRGSDVTVEYHGPSSPERIEARADAGQLRQVVWNLVRNAVQASSPGATVLVQVTPPSSTTGHAWVLEVRDSGPGIDAQAADRLFDPFFTTRSAGVGIGLAVVKRIVDDHGWKIEIDSRQGRGATFRVLARDDSLA